MRTAISRGQWQCGKAVAVGASTGKTRVPKTPYCQGECNPRPGHYLTHAHGHIAWAVEAMDSCFALTWVHQHGRAVGQWPVKTRVFLFLVFWRSKGRGAMPQGHENKGNKTIRQKEKQQQQQQEKTRVTCRVKRPPKWKGGPPYGASPPTSPGKPASRLQSTLS